MNNINNSNRINEIRPSVAKEISVKPKKSWTLYLIICCACASLASFSFGFNVGALNIPEKIIRNVLDKSIFKEFDHSKVELNNLSVHLDQTIEIYNSSLKLYTRGKEKFNQALKEYDIRESRFNKLLAESNIKKILGFKLNENNEEEQKIMITHHMLELEKNLLENSRSQIKDDLRYIKKASLKLEKLKKQIEFDEKYVQKYSKLLWIFLNAVFVIGGLFGAFTTKNVVDKIGRKNGIICHYFFSVLGSILILISTYYHLPELIFISRFAYGIQGGMSCGLVPTYINEISPIALREVTSHLHQIFFTVGIFVAQVLGFKEILGTNEMIHFLLAAPLVIAFFGSISLLIISPETPKALLFLKNDKRAALRVLKKLRNSEDVSCEIQLMNEELKESKSFKPISIIKLLITRDYRLSLLASLMLLLSQPLSGVNAIFFFSSSIFLNAGIHEDLVQYIVALVGLSHIIFTVTSIPIIVRLGRKPLLFYPTIIIILSFVLLTISLSLKDTSPIFQFISIASIMIFIMCFSLGLGPLPFVYVAECFTQAAKGSALALGIFVNWLGVLFITVFFLPLMELLNHYVFLVFAVVLLLSATYIKAMIPETKKKTEEEILFKLNGNKCNDNSKVKLIPKINY